MASSRRSLNGFPLTSTPFLRLGPPARSGEGSIQRLGRVGKSPCQRAPENTAVRRAREFRDAISVLLVRRSIVWLRAFRLGRIPEGRASVGSPVAFPTMRGDDHDLRALLVEIDAGQPDDDACLEWLRERRYPEGIHCDTCSRVTKHHRVARRRSYSCQHCGHHVHPTTGTIFHGSTTPLTTWFRAVVMLRESEGEVTAKDLQRELGVTYKTAWRIANRIRTALAEEKPVPAARGYALPALGGYPRRARSFLLYSSRTGQQRFRQALGSAISQQGEVGGVKRATVLGLELLGVALAAVIGLYAFGVIGTDDARDTRRQLEALETKREKRERSRPHGPAEPDDWFIAQRAGGPDKQLDRTGSSAPRPGQARSRESPSTEFRGDWELTGPTNVGGRIVDLVVDPTNADTILRRSRDGRHLEEHRRRHRDGEGVAGRPAAGDGRARDRAPTARSGPAPASRTTAAARSSFGGNGVYRSTDGGQTLEAPRSLPERDHRAHRRRPERSGHASTSPRQARCSTPAATAGSTARPTAATRGSSSSLRRTGSRAASTSRSIRATRTGSSRRCGSAGASRTCGPTAASARASSAPIDGGDTLEAARERHDAQPRRHDRPDPVRDARADRHRARPGNPNRVYVITTADFGQDKGFYVSNDGGDSFQAPPADDGRARRAASAGGSAGSGSIPSTRTTSSRPASTCAARRTAGQRGPTRRASTPTSTRWRGSPHVAEPRVPRQRRRHVRLRHQRGERHLAPGRVRAVHAVLLARRRRAVPRTPHRRRSGQRVPALVGLPDEPGRPEQLELVRLR